MAWDKARTFRWLLISVAVTVAGTLALWWFFGGIAFFGFLFLPFIPILFGTDGKDEAAAPTARGCPRCGYEARTPDEHYCPRDAEPLR